MSTNNPMHVTFVLQDTGSLYGAERATLDLAAGLLETGRIRVSVTLIAETRLNTSTSLARAFEQAGITCQSIQTNHRFSLSLVRALRALFERQSVDCVHVVGYKAAVHVALATRFGRLRPWVSTVHGWLERRNLKERFYGWTEIQALKRARRVVVLSKFSLERLKAKGIREDRLVWIPSGLRLENLAVDERTEPAPDIRPTVGILGRLSSEKNHPMFLRVAQRLVQQTTSVRFLIAGDGPERANIERMIRRFGLGPHVEMPGMMDRADFFRQVDILALCSRIENLPYVILEAMASSCPVVATRVGGVPDLVESGANGLLVPLDDVDAMAAALGRLLEDADLRHVLGTAGRRTLQTRFTLARSVEMHLNVYQAFRGHATSPTRTNQRVVR